MPGASGMSYTLIELWPHGTLGQSVSVGCGCGYLNSFCFYDGRCQSDTKDRSNVLWTLIISLRWEMAPTACITRQHRLDATLHALRIRSSTQSFQSSKYRWRPREYSKETVQTSFPLYKNLTGEQKFLQRLMRIASVLNSSTYLPLNNMLKHKRTEESKSLQIPWNLAMLEALASIVKCSLIQIDKIWEYKWDWNVSIENNKVVPCNMISRNHDAMKVVTWLPRKIQSCAVQIGVYLRHAYCEFRGSTTQGWTQQYKYQTKLQCSIQNGSTERKKRKQRTDQVLARESGSFWCKWIPMNWSSIQVSIHTGPWHAWTYQLVLRGYQIVLYDCKTTKTYPIKCADGQNATIKIKLNPYRFRQNASGLNPHPHISKGEYRSLLERKMEICTYLLSKYPRNISEAGRCGNNVCSLLILMHRACVTMLLN